MRPPDPFADRYTKLRLVGRGGFGVVYRAWDTEMERDIALKLLNPELAVDVDWRKRFRLEATAASKLQHPNITIVFDRGEYESQPFIVMEFVEGEPLSKIIEQRISLSDPERLFLIEQLCDGLHYAHQRSIVHRDVKPVNLVVREDHDGTHLVRTLKILDFGIAKVVNTGQTSTGGMMFTPSYVSPEQIRGEEVDRRSDMFAVGAVAYELLVLRKAFDIISKNPFTFLEEVKQKICEEPHQPMTAIRPDVDPELSAVIDRALAKAPEDRFKDLAEMRRSLHRIRTRLEESEPSTSQTTIVLNSKLQAVVKQARQALEADDPSAAVAHLQKALGSASNKVVQRFIEQSLEEAQERQAAKRLERRARDEGAARAAIENAKVEFERGDSTLAIRRLDEFQPADLVAEARGEIARAAALVRRAERIIAEGTAADRDAVLRELEGFTPDDLVKAALARLRARDGLERAAAARAQAAVQSARESFSAGNRIDALRSLEQFDEPRRIDSALNELREADTAIEQAASAVRSGSRRERSEALDGLDAFPYPDLVAHALGELRSIDREMRATEDLDQAAEALIKSARDQFDRGDRNGPIARLQGFVPAHPRVTAALVELRARVSHLEEEEKAAVEAAAQSAIARARKRFAEGAPQEAIDGLRKFAKPGMVADAVRTLEQFAIVVARTEERVRTGNADERRGALDKLARAGGGELTDAALATLRALDAKRSADEQRLSEEQQKALEAERVAAARAQEAIVAARDAFSAGNRADAITRLEKFDEPGRVNAALNELRAANAAVELASKAVRTGPRREREAALGRLEASPHRDLIARELAELRAAAAEMRAAEVRDEAAAALIESAREQFDRGDRTGPLARLEAFTPAHPGVTAALEELRDRVRQLEEEEKAAVEAAAQNAIAKARKRFAEGARKDAIDGLRKFIKPSLVAAAVAELDQLATVVARTEERVRTGTPDERRGAIEKLARAGSSELTETAIATLRALDAKRTADEQREKQEKQKALDEQRARLELEKEARALEAKARAIFVKGKADEALRLLTGFGASGLVAETLRTLQAAASDIEAARAAVAREPAPLRRTAIERLERRAPQDLFAHAVLELKKVDEERRAAEERAEAERIAAAAERLAVDARQQFARGEHEAALKALQAFTPVLPPVASALEDLRREYAQILAVRAEEEKERKRLEAERAAKVREVTKLVAEADKAAADKRFDEAAAVLDRASALVPDSGDLAKARTRLARAIDSEETRARRVRIRAVLEQVNAAVDTGEFATAADRLSEAEKLGARPGETTPLREHLRAAQDELTQMSAALATAKAAILAAAAEPNADARVKALDRTLGAALTVPPGTHAAAKLWPEYHDALQRIRDLRQEVAVAEARGRIERALAERSTRKAERALRNAEAAFPGVAWKDLQLKLEALQSARATEPSILGRALPQVRRVPVMLVAALAALVIAVIVLAVWRPWVRTAPPPPKVEAPPDPGPKRPTLVEQAASSLAAGRRGEALKLALESLKANDRDQPTLQLLTRLRTESASATSAARDKAVSAGGASHPDFKAAEQKTADAQALTDPGRTEAAVRTFDEATALYQRIETTSFSAAKFLAAAEQERTAGRAEPALSYALQGISQFPKDEGLTGFLSALRREAADKVASARAAAVKAGATDASATFRSARDRERFATARGGPEQTGDALVALREADGLYRQAAKEADQLRADQLQQQQAAAEKLKQDIAAGLKAAETELKGGRLEAAIRAVNGVLARDPNNPTARQLQQSIREAVKERDRLANEAGERKRRQGEAATLVDQAKRAASPQQAIDLLVQAEQLDSSNGEIAPLLAQKRLELKNRSDPGPITPPTGTKPPLPDPGPATNTGAGDEQLILRTIQQYAAAMTARNPGDVVELFPSATRRDLENTFKMFSEYSFQLQPVSGVQINGNSATVRCTLRLQTNSGQQGRMTQPDRVTVVRLTKAGNRWVIQSLGG